MVYTFRSPLGKDETCIAIKLTVESMNGTIEKVSDGCYRARWRTQPYHSARHFTLFPPEFTFYVGDEVVRAVTGTDYMRYFVMRFIGVRGVTADWNAFIESLMKLYPGFDFGIKPGLPELVAIQFVDDGIEQVFVSTTKNSPSLGGAALGGLLFGTAGAIIGASAGTSYTTGTSSSRFSGSLLARGRYSNGLLAEGMLDKNSPQYHEIMVNMSKLSEMTEN